MAKTEEELAKKIRTKKPQFKGKKWKTVSDKAKSFILKLLEKNAKRRLTSDRAMRDPWIRELRTKKLDLKKEDVLALKRFSKYSRLKQIGLVVMAHFADRDMVQNVVRTFASVDEDSSGRIDEQELVDELKRYDVGEEEAKMIFHNIDQDSSGSVRFSEFLAPMLEDHVSTKAACREVFNLMDSEKRGFITREYFRKMVDGLVSTEMIEKIMEEADSDGDGKIDFEEFANTMLGDRKDRESSPKLTSLSRQSRHPLLNRPRSSSLVAVRTIRARSARISIIPLCRRAITRISIVSPTQITRESLERQRSKFTNTQLSLRTRTQVHYTKSVSGDMQEIDGDGVTLKVDDDPLVLDDGSNNSDDQKKD